MWLKVVIVLLFVALVASLFTSLGFLLKDREADSTTKRRAWNALTVRLILVSLMMAAIFYGVFTGQLGSHAPWDARYEKELTQ